MKYLINEDLFLINEEDYKDYDLEFANVENSIGIMTSIIDSKRVYYVYRTEDLSHMHYTVDIVPIMYKIEYDNFKDALMEAKRKYKGLLLYNKSIGQMKLHLK